MSEYDAFGRKKGDSPLEQPESTPVAAAPATPARSGGSRTFGVMAAVAGVFIMASVGLSAALLTGGDDEGVIEPVVVTDGGAPPTEEGGTATDGAAPPTEEGGTAPAGSSPAPAREPRGLDEGSLIRRPVLARAIKALRVAELGRPVSFRLAPARIDVQLKTSSGRLRSVQVGPAGVPREISLSGEGFGHIQAMAWTDIDPRAPERMVRAAAERAKRPAADVDYLVLLDVGKPTWGLFFQGGMHFQGNATGRITRRVN